MISISSAHGLKIRGAKHFIDEVDESRRVVNRVEQILRSANVTVRVFHDQTSTTASKNLQAINAWHRQRPRDRHVAVHFNAAHPPTDSPRGVEVLHKNQPTLAANVSLAIANAGRLRNRGSKVRSNFSFLNNNNNAILPEIAFVDSREDVRLYTEHFEAICRALAES